MIFLLCHAQCSCLLAYICHWSVQQDCSKSSHTSRWHMFIRSVSLFYWLNVDVWRSGALLCRLLLSYLYTWFKAFCCHNLFLNIVCIVLLCGVSVTVLATDLCICEVSGCFIYKRMENIWHTKWFFFSKEGTPFSFYAMHYWCSSLYYDLLVFLAEL